MTTKILKKRQFRASLGQFCHRAAGKIERNGTDTFFLKEGQNIFCPYITVEKDFRTFRIE